MLCEFATGDPITPIPGFADPVSSWTHLIATVWFACMSVALLRAGRGHRGRTTALAIYCFSLVLLFSMSAVFHLLPYATAGRTVLQRLDHASIFVLIAGTFTAVHGILFRGVMRWGIITLFWVATATAVPLKTVFFEQTPEWVGLTLYLGLPWIGLLTAVRLWRRRGPHYIVLLFGGGVAYTLGAVLEFLRWPNPWPGVVQAHELFHLCVFAGALLHWLFVRRIAGEAVAVEQARLRRPRSFLP
jgi:channel protein (hemolysin III family)